jgi:hypothetical protein
MKAMLHIVFCVCLLMVGIAYGMDDAPSSPSLQSGSGGVEDVCGVLRGLALFIGCCIYDVPHYVESAFKGLPQDIAIEPYPTSPAWESRSVTLSRTSSLTHISAEKKKD